MILKKLEAIVYSARVQRILGYLFFVLLFPIAAIRGLSAKNRQFIKQHALPADVAAKFDDFFKTNKLNYRLFKSKGSILKKRLFELGFERICDASNSLVMICPASLGKFVIKGPGSFHRLTIKELKKPMENISRIQGAERINSFVMQHGLRFVRAVDEFLYHIPGAPWGLNDYNYLIVEPLLDIDSEKTFEDLTVAQLNEVFMIIEGTHYDDVHDGNIVQTKNGEIVFLDVSLREYLHEYGDLDKRLRFSIPDSASEQDPEANDAPEKTISFEERLANILCDESDPLLNNLGWRMHSLFDLFFNGFLPLAKSCKASKAKQKLLSAYILVLDKELQKLLSELDTNEYQSLYVEALDSYLDDYFFTDVIMENIVKNCELDVINWSTIKLNSQTSAQYAGWRPSSLLFLKFLPRYWILK
jgi:hypothetical protein